MIASTKRDSTCAVSPMVSPRPSCISEPVSIRVSPPSSRMATSKDTRVRVEGRSNTIARVLPVRGRSAASSPFRRRPLMAALASRTRRSSAPEKSFRSRK